MFRHRSNLVPALAALGVAVVLAVMVAVGMAVALRAQPQSGGEVVLMELEARLQAAAGVDAVFEVTAEGVVEAQLAGRLYLDEDGTAELTAEGTFLEQKVDVGLQADANRLRGRTPAGSLDEPRPPALAEALIVGLTRMGVLHNLARLVAGATPDHGEGGVGEWVEVTDVEIGETATVDGHRARPLSFYIEVAGQPAGQAVLWLDANSGLPVRREQKVEFEQGEMRVVERYPQLRLEPSAVPANPD